MDSLKHIGFRGLVFMPYWGSWYVGIVTLLFKGHWVPEELAIQREEEDVPEQGVLGHIVDDIKSLA